MRDSRREQLHNLYRAHLHDLYGYVHGLCRDHQLAEDVVQDVFITVARTVDVPDEVSVGWLKRVGRNRLIDVLRRRDNYSRKLRLVGAPASTGPLGGDDCHLGVSEALDTLSPLHRTVLALRYLEGVPVAELAEMLDRTPKAVEALVTRSRRAFRHALEVDDE